MQARMALPGRNQAPRAGKGAGGFTLIELLIVVAIVGIISAIAVPAYQRYQIRTQATAALADASSLRTAVEADLLGIASFAQTVANGLAVDMDTATITATRPLGELTLTRSEAGSWLCGHTFDTALPGCSAQGQYHVVSAATAGLGFAEITLPGEPSDGTHRLTGSYSGNDTRIEIPAEFGGNTLTEIFQDTFNDTGLEEVVFAADSNIRQIHARAFRNNDIQKVVLPDSLERLDWGAFSNNPNLNQVTIGSGVALEGNVFNAMSSFESAYGEGGAGTYVLENGQWTKQ